MKSIKPYDISTRRVLEAYWHVKANRGAAGIDEVSLEMYEANLSTNLYKLWNRMSSGSYVPPPVMQVEISKKQGGVRVLGVPTVADRIAQQVVKARIEGELEELFHPDSYGYRPNKSAADAVAVTRKRCWKYDWCIEFDIRRAFDELDWDLLRKAIRKHVKDPWALLYIERWLVAPAVNADGQTIQRTKGVPQGSVIGPVMMNLFMHYCFDAWMQREHPQNPFARYADDAVTHCRSEAEANRLLQAIEGRMKQCKLELHPEKSGIVYCKDKNRPEHYLPAVSASAIKRMNQHIREWRLHRQTSVGLHELARQYNPKLRGWMSYYGQFYRSGMRRVFTHFERRLVKWARRKYRHLRWHPRRAHRWLARMVKRYPRLFTHWLTSRRVSVWTMGAV